MFLESLSGSWYDTSYTRNLRHNTTQGQFVAWGASFGDVDNDADLDAVVAFGFIDLGDRWKNPVEQPDSLFLQQDDGLFAESAFAWGVSDRDSSRGFVLADINDDGWLDMSKQSLNGNRKLYLSRCGDEAWMRVRAHQSSSPNTQAIGARIRLHSGDIVQERTLRAGGTNHASSGPAEAHFGLARLDTVERVEIVWPDQQISTFDDVPTRQILTITRE